MAWRTRLMGPHGPTELRYTPDFSGDSIWDAIAWHLRIWGEGVIQVESERNHPNIGTIVGEACGVKAAVLIALEGQIAREVSLPEELNPKG